MVNETMVYPRTRSRMRVSREQRSMNREEILQTIRSLRRGRDQMRASARAAGEWSGGNGMAAAFHLAAHYVWRDYVRANC